MYMDRSALLKALSSLDGGGVKEGDILFEVGSVAYTGVYTDSTDVPVPTKLNKIIAGFAVPFDSYSPITDTDGAVSYILSVAPDITEDTNSHRKTFNIWRSSQAKVDGLKVCYIVFGRIYDTVAH